MPPPTRLSVSTTASSAFFSLPMFLRPLLVFPELGVFLLAVQRRRRFSFASKSKIPPQLGRLRLQSGERRGDLVDAFGFHGRTADKLRWADYTRRPVYSSSILSSKNEVGLGAAMKRR